MYKIKSINLQSLLEFFCYIIFGSLILYLVLSQKYLYYVTPRMKPYLYFSSIIMFLWAFSSLPKIFTFKYKVRSSHCFVLALPALMLILPHSQINSSDVSSFGYSGSNSLSGFSKTISNESLSSSSSNNLNSSEISDYQTNTIKTEETLNTSSDSLSNSYSTPQQDVYAPTLSGLDNENKKITVSNEDYGMWMTEIYSNMNNYSGYAIELTGFVYKDENFKNDEFSPSRLMMTCCTADLTPAGLLCKYENASSLSDNSWVKVTGNISIGSYEYEGNTYYEPEIIATKIEDAEEVTGYVYPY